MHPLAPVLRRALLEVARRLGNARRQRLVGAEDQIDLVIQIEGGLGDDVVDRRIRRETQRYA